MPIPSAPMPMWFADTDPPRRRPARRGVPPVGAPVPEAVPATSRARGTSALAVALSVLAAGTLRSAVGAATARRARRRAGHGRSA